MQQLHARIVVIKLIVSTSVARRAANNFWLSNTSILRARQPNHQYWLSDYIWTLNASSWVVVIIAFYLLIQTEKHVEQNQTNADEDQDDNNVRACIYLLELYLN